MAIQIENVHEIVLTEKEYADLKAAEVKLGVLRKVLPSLEYDSQRVSVAYAVIGIGGAADELEGD